MKILLQSIFGHRRQLLRSSGCRYFAASTEVYAKRNYAQNVLEYNSVVESLTFKRRNYLLRDAYEDMVLDGVRPNRDTFHSLIVGTMKGARLQDAFFFREEMRTMGLVPDVNLYNFLISTCGKCRNSDQAVQIFEEMKKYDVKPNGQTYICLLNACATDGRLDRVYAIVRDMTAAGAGLNMFCYVGLITAHLNKTPLPDDIASKIMELVEQSKGWSSVESSGNNAENMMLRVTEEELYNLPTAEYAYRRGGFLNRGFAVYHVAFQAFADLKNVQAMESLLEMLQKEDKYPDAYILMQVMRCYLYSGDIDNGYRILQEFDSSGLPPFVELYVTFIDGAMVGYTPKGMQLAQDTLINMTSRNLNLNPKLGSDLLLVAAGEKTGGYTVANFLWDLMEKRGITPFSPAVEAYYYGLKEREVPSDDPRVLKVCQTLDKLSVGRNFGRPGIRNRQGPA